VIVNRAQRAAEDIVRTLRNAGQVAYFAGGCVRDLLLGVEPKDFDVATDAPPERVMALFRRTEQVGAQFGVVLVRSRGIQIEVATFRTDGHYADGRHPDSVEFGNEFDDARRRDFTINGMYFDPASGRFIDHVGGRADLKDKLIRAIGDPELRFQEDHLRLLRAVRFAARLGFAIHDDTFAAIKRHAHRLPAISPERVRKELRLILCHPARADGWRLLVDSGLSDTIVGGVTWSPSEVAAVAERLANMTEYAGFGLVLAVIFRAIAPEVAAKACRSLRCSNVETAGVAWMLAQLPRVQKPANLETADIKLLLADSRFEELLELLRVDLLADARPPHPYQMLRERCAAIPPDQVSPAPLITGTDLLDRGVPQGPQYARILDAIYRAQLNEEINDQSEALIRLEDMLKPIGPSTDESLGQ